MEHKKVYNVFQINVLVFYITSLMLVPVLVIFTYIFDVQLYTSTNTIILVASFILLVYFVAGLIYVLTTKEKFKRKLKPSYQKEFSFVMSLSGLGVLGMGILYLYFGGIALYVPHVIIPLAIAVFTGLYLVGNRYFNVSLLQRRKR